MLQQQCIEKLNSTTLLVLSVVHYKQRHLRGFAQFCIIFSPLWLCHTSNISPEEKLTLVASPFFANLAWCLGWFSVRMSVLEKRSAPR